MVPVFDQFVMAGVTEDKFSMQLCSSSELDPSAEPTVAGTMVCKFLFIEHSGCGQQGQAFKIMPFCSASLSVLQDSDRV